jgi:hypothetical protein
MAAVVELGTADGARVELEDGAEVAGAAVGDGVADGDSEAAGPQATTMTRPRNRASLFIARGTPYLP